LNQVLLAVLFAASLSVLLGSQVVLADAPPPKITYIGVVDENCKKFEITDKDGFKEGSISNVTINSLYGIFTPTIEEPMIETMPNIVPAESHERDNGLYKFLWIESKPTKVTLTVCPDPDLVGDSGAAWFDIQVTDAQKPKGKKSPILFVSEVVVESDRDKKFEDKVVILKTGAKCADVTKADFKTENIESFEIVECNPHALGSPVVTIKGKLLDGTKPGIINFLGDPFGDFFLGIMEICLPEFLECPTDFVTSIDIPPQKLIGGESFPINTNALFLAAAQSPVWMTSLTIAALGIGAYVFTRNPSNLRNVKAILQYYLDRF